MNRMGCIQVYTGNGKGKTTAALGMALRAAGRGMKSYFIQFLKQGDYGELTAVARHLQPWVTIEQFGLPDFHYSGNEVSAEEQAAARNGLAVARRVLREGLHEIVVLDEVNTLLHFGILPLAEVLDVIDGRPPHVELVLTGRYAPAEIQERADLITEMREVRHYYQKNIPARLGIEY